MFGQMLSWRIGRWLDDAVAVRVRFALPFFLPRGGSLIDRWISSCLKGIDGYARYLILKNMGLMGHGVVGPG